ncbi:hypothetical protein SAMN05444581_104149 [Methylocapsa palsarum]|uniref:Uncharacterized protein n=1 Tax=Methylocapsa palsarum TaxID=1612308 RepID=A0A1I3XXB2_9HYPH|nr:hypothetical protein SAMN05444581_104149 [Methylocapsa palsarum]
MKVRGIAAASACAIGEPFPSLAGAGVAKNMLKHLMLKRFLIDRMTSCDRKAL